MSVPVTKLTNRLDTRDFGAAGDGVTDDTDALQHAIFEAHHRGRSVVYIDRHVCDGRLFVPGSVTIEGKGPDSALMLTGEMDTFWIVCGLTREGAVAGSAEAWTHPTLPGVTYNFADQAATWRGEMRNFRVETPGASQTSSPAGIRAVTIFSGVDCSVRDVVFDFTGAVDGTELGALAAQTNAAWLSGMPTKQRIHYDRVTAHAPPTEGGQGKEAIAQSDSYAGRITRCNTVGAWADDVIGLHRTVAATVEDCDLETYEGRILLGSVTGGTQIAANRMRRISDKDAVISAGGAFIFATVDGTNAEPPQDVTIADNEIWHHPAQPSIVGGIQLRGSRRFTIHGNRVHDFTGFGRMLTWNTFSTDPTWVDPTGVEQAYTAVGEPGEGEPAYVARTRDLKMYGNSGFAHSGSIDSAFFAQQGAAVDHPGPVVSFGNTPTPTTMTLATRGPFEMLSHELSADSTPELNFDGTPVHT